MIKFVRTQDTATRITVKLEGNTEKYALSFLHIWNNAREHSDVIYKVENTYDNRVFVTCPIESADAIKEYLEQFGEIVDTEEVIRHIISAEYDSRGWDILWGNEKEVEFYLDIE